MPHAVEGDRQPEQADVAIGTLLQHAERLGLRMFEHFRNRLHGRIGDAGAVQDVLPFAARARRHELLDQPVQHILVVYPIRIAAKARVADPFRVTEYPRQQRKQLVVAGGDDDETVFRGVTAIGHDHGGARPLPLRHFAGSLEIGGVIAHPAEHGLIERGVDRGAGAAVAPLQKGGENADHGPHARGHVDDRGADPDRRLVRLSRHAHQAAERLHQGIIAGAVLERARAAEGADGAIDQRRFEGAQRLGVEAELRRRARPQILNDDVRPLDNEPPQPFALARVLQVHHGRTLVAVETLEGGGHRAPVGRRPAAGIVAVGLLDLDYVGTEVAENLPGIWRRHAVSELDHRDAVERQTSRHSQNPRGQISSAPGTL